MNDDGCFDNPSSYAAADYYAVLQCNASSSTSSSDIKAAYYRLALLYHPDKQQQDRRPFPFSSLAAAAGGSVSETTVAHGQSTVNLDCSGVAVPSSIVHRGAGLSFELISQAYQVLSNEELRRDYDERRAVRVHAGVNAEDVSINEFDRDDDSCGDDCYYYRQCRCGDLYEITLNDLRRGYSLVQCGGCSLYLNVTS